jgi:hypothetical protein
MARESEFSAVPTLSPVGHSTPRTQTIETSLIHRRDFPKLPPEHAPLHSSPITPRARTPLGPNSIFSNFTLPYDISHRRPSTKHSRRNEYPDLDPALPPTFVNCVPARGHKWVAPERSAARKLREKLEEIERESIEASATAESHFDAATITIATSVAGYQQILDEFIGQAIEKTPEREPVMRKVAEFYRQLAEEIPRLRANFVDRYAQASKELEAAKEENEYVLKERDALTMTLERQTRTVESLTSQIRDLQTRCAIAEAQVRDAQNERGSILRSSQTNQQRLVEIGREIDEQRMQEVKLNDLIDTLSKEMSRRTGELENAAGDLGQMQLGLNLLREEVKGVNDKYADRSEYCQKLRNTPLEELLNANKGTQETECQLVPEIGPPQAREFGEEPSDFASTWGSLKFMEGQPFMGAPGMESPHAGQSDGFAARSGLQLRKGAFSATLPSVAILGDVGPMSSISGAQGAVGPVAAFSRTMPGRTVQFGPAGEPPQTIRKSPSRLGSVGGPEGSASRFAQTKSDMRAVQEALGIEREGGVLVIRNLDDLMKARNRLLENNGIFDHAVSSIIRAQCGKFSQYRGDHEECRICAKWIMSRVMKKALTWIEFAEKGVQTEAMEILMDEEAPSIGIEESPSQARRVLIQKAPLSLVQFVVNSRFVKLLKADYSDRPPKSLDWLVHVIRSVYDEKTVDDRARTSNHQPVLPFPEYLLMWALRQYGHEELATKLCWDVFIATHTYGQRYADVTMFIRFLDEHLTVNQLTFFLDCRKWILERCVTIPVEHPDLGLYFAETYLATCQVHAFFRAVFVDTEEELIENMAGRGLACIDPHRTDSANIPMSRILDLAVTEEHDARVRRVRKMLAFYRPVPRMTLRRFEVFVRKMISNVNPSLVDSLYRSALVQNSVRVDMDQGAFIDLFRKFTKCIVPAKWNRPVIEAEQFAAFSPVYSVVLDRWKMFAPFILETLQTLKRSAGEEFAALSAEMHHEMFQVLEAKHAFDGAWFYQNYHRLLQSVMQVCLRFNIPDQVSLIRQASEAHQLLLDKFQLVLVAAEGGPKADDPSE